jgi:hypothetical protein
VYLALLGVGKVSFVLALNGASGNDSPFLSVASGNCGYVSGRECVRWFFTQREVFGDGL